MQVRKGHIVLLIVLATAIALVGCNALPEEMVPASSAGPAIEGQPIAAAAVRLYDTPQKSNLLYEIQGNRVYSGAVSQGQTILYFDGRRIFRGANTTGEILFTVSGNRIFVGPNTTGPLAYTVSNGRVYEGSENGPVLYTIQGERVFRGANTTGDIVFQANVPLTGSVQFLIPVLADRRF